MELSEVHDCIRVAMAAITATLADQDRASDEAWRLLRPSAKALGDSKLGAEELHAKVQALIHLAANMLILTGSTQQALTAEEIMQYFALSFERRAS